MKKYYEEAKYNAAFDRCIDVMAQLIQKYGPQLLETSKLQQQEKQGSTKNGVLLETGEDAVKQDVCERGCKQISGNQAA